MSAARSFLQSTKDLAMKTQDFCHVLVVGGLDHTLEKLERLGVGYSMMQIPARVSDRQVHRARRLCIMDYRDMEEVLLLARAWHACDPFDAVISFTEYGLEPASRVAIDLGIPGNNLEAVRLTRDKIRMRECLARHGLSPVRHRVCQSVDDALALRRDLDGAPIVLKPYAGGLSEGVFFVDDDAHLAERFAWTQSAMSGPVLAEEFLTGPEFSVESISTDGRHEIAMVTEKITTELPRFIELGHQVPARLDPATRAQVDALVLRFLDVVGQRTGPCHTEIRLTPMGPRIIESQTRIGGDQIWEMCELVSGVDLMSETVCALTGLPSPDRQPRAGAAAIRFFAFEDTAVRDVQGLDAAAQAPGVVRIKCMLEAGQSFGRLVSSDSRQGYALCTGDDIEQAVIRAEAALGLVRVHCEPLPANAGANTDVGTPSP